MRFGRRRIASGDCGDCMSRIVPVRSAEEAGEETDNRSLMNEMKSVKKSSRSFRVRFSGLKNEGRFNLSLNDVACLETVNRGYL